MAITITTPKKRSWLPGLTAMLAVLSCKGVVIAAAIFPLVKFVMPVNPHIQAAVISLFCLLTFAVIVVNYKQCHANPGPVIFCATGAMLVIGSMYIAYNEVVEGIGLVALIGAAIWSWWIVRRQSKRADSVKVSALAAQ